MRVIHTGSFSADCSIVATAAWIGPRLRCTGGAATGVRRWSYSAELSCWAMRLLCSVLLDCEM